MVGFPEMGKRYMNNTLKCTSVAKVSSHEFASNRKINKKNI